MVLNIWDKVVIVSYKKQFQWPARRAEKLEKPKINFHFSKKQIQYDKGQH